MDTNGFAVVTGTSSGIGAALATKLAARGYDVLSIARRPPPSAGSGRIRHLALDLTDSDAIPRVVAEVEYAGGTVDLVVNNAGVQFSHCVADPFKEDSSAALRTEIALNLEVPIGLTWSLFDRMARPGGAVVNVTSLTALHPKASSPVYSAAKAGLRSFTRALRLQAEPLGIHVMEAIPPLVDTAMTSGRGKGKISPEAMADAILAGLADRRRVVAPGLSGKLLRLNRLLPELVARSLARS
jgi:short-subunit dehydrogenase